MYLQPKALVRYATFDQVLGVMDQAAFITQEDFALLAGITSFETHKLIYEKNTGSLILRPENVPTHIEIADCSFSDGDISNTIWEQIYSHGTNQKSLWWRNATANVSYHVDLDPALTPVLDTAFALTLQIGGCPQNAGHTAADASFVRDETDYYRKIEWPVNSRVGENRYRVVLSYGVPPYLELSTDAGASWKQIREIPNPVDISGTQMGGNIEITLSVIPLENSILFFLGQGVERFSFAYSDDTTNAIGYKAGPIRMSAKNGTTGVSFAQILYDYTGYFISYPHPGPRHMEKMPAFAPQGTIARGQKVTGRVEQRDFKHGEYTYRLTLSGTRMSNDKSSPYYNYSRRTPIVKGVHVIWPAVWAPPKSGRWREVEGVRQITEDLRFDPQSRTVTRWGEVIADNRAGQFRRNPGIRAIEIWMGYAHTGLFLRSRLLGNTRGTLHADGPDSTYRFEGDDLFWVIKDQPITDRINPTLWCTRTLMRLLLQHARVVPELMATIPFCAYGQNPVGCPHTKMPARHPGWEEGTLALSCMSEVKEVVFASMGQDTYGQFIFQDFDPDLPYYRKKTFKEIPSWNGSDVDELLHLGVGVQRDISLDDTKNDFTFVGWQQSSGQIFAVHDQDYLSLNVPSSPNYIGFPKPLVHLWSGYVDPAYTIQVMERTKRWARLPNESVTFACYGQPTIFPLDVVTVRERRTTGSINDYFATRVRSVYQYPHIYHTNIQGIWTGRGLPPGWV